MSKALSTTIEILDQFEVIAQATSTQAVIDSFRGCLKGHGFSSCLITTLPGPHGLNWYRQIIVDGWPEGWFDCYQSQKHYLHDPCAKRSRETGDPFLWSEVTAGSIGEPANLVMREAAAFGLREGICVPILAPFGAPAVVSIAGEFTDIRPSTVHVVAALARHAFQTLLSINTESAARPVLSEREREILQWTGDGKTAWETSRILGLSEHTVYTHLKNARRKLDAANITHAVVVAARKGEIRI